MEPNQTRESRQYCLRVSKIIIILEFLGTLFLLVGFVAPGFLIEHYHTERGKVRSYTGLWYIVTCTDAGCKSKPIDWIMFNRPGEDRSKKVNPYVVYPILGTVAMFTSIVSTIANAVNLRYSRTGSTKRWLYMVQLTSSFIACFFSVVVAISYSTDTILLSYNGFVSAYFPYSVFFFCMGGALAFLTATQRVWFALRDSVVNAGIISDQSHYEHVGE